MKLFKATEINWDTDGVPTALPLSAYVYTDDEGSVADALSDEFGFCIHNLSIEEVTTDTIFDTECV
jgi:hypothetical protein